MNSNATVARNDATEPPPGERIALAPLVKGPIARTLVLFSLPIFASNILQSLNASINAAWIGHLLGARALTASANANSLLFFLLSISFGLSLAATILIGQSLGAQDLTRTKRVMGTSFLFNFMMMALRGAGNSRTPFFFMLISATLDVGLNPLLIEGIGPFPRLGIAGSALATGIAQWTALLLLTGWLYHRHHILCLGRGETRYFRIDGAVLRSLLTKGIPMGLQVIVVSSSMILMISLVNRYGSLTVAAYGACFQLWNYIQMPAFAIGSAVSSMAAQNVGAGRWDRVNRIAISGVIYNVVLTGALIGAVTLSDNAAFSLFLGNNRAAIVIAQHMHLIVSWSFILFGISFVLASVVRATGAVIPPLLILIIAIWGIRIPAAALLSHSGVDGILWGFPAGSIASVLMTIAYFRFGRWRMAKMIVEA